MRIPPSLNWLFLPPRCTDACSRSIVGEIKDDTEVIREVAEVIRLLQTDDVLARLDTREKPTESQNKVERWLEKMADYTSYAETAYQATTVDPAEEEEKKWADLTSIPDLGGESPPMGSGPSLPPVPEMGDFLDVHDAMSFVDSASESRLSLSLSRKQSPEPGSMRQRWSTPSSTALGTATSTLDGPTSTNLTVYSDAAAPPCPSEPPPGPPMSTEPQPPKRPLSPTPGHTEVSPGDDARSEGQQELPTIDWSPLVPEHIPQAEFDHLVSSVKKDEEAIARAHGRRLKLSTDRRKRLDTTLLSAVTGSDGRPVSKRPARCTSLLARGATLSEEFTSSALVQVVEQKDVQTLAVLLRYGVDPDSQGQTSDSRQPLAVAASSDMACLCALILAGACIKGADRPDVCAMFCQSGTQARSIRIFCSPLLAAFASIRPQYRRTINVAQFWTAHFLLVNGGDVNAKTCTSVMELVVRHWPITSQYRITKHLLSFGIDLTSQEVELQFRFAMEEGTANLAQLLLENGVSAGEVARRGSPAQDPIVLAATGKHWDCVDLVLGQKDVDHIHLFSLVHVHMRDTSPQLSPRGFERAVRAFVGRGCSTSWAQTREKWEFSRQLSSAGGENDCERVEELVSVLELAERIVNKNGRDRERIIRVINDLDTPTTLGASDTK